MTSQVAALTRRAVTRRLPRAGLDGGARSGWAWLLLAAGTAGGPGFTGIYLAKDATRAGYWTLAPPVSGLVMDGLFAPNPSGGYPPGAHAAAPAVHGSCLPCSR